MSEAVAPLREALAMSPDNVPLRLALARTLVDAGRPREALDEFREVLERDPSRAEVREELAKCAVACGRLEEAREVYAKGDGVVRDLDLERTLRGGEEEEAILPVAGAQPITFADVGGLEGLKERLRMDIVYPLQKPELFRAYGKRAGGGVLLFGPPGCGKTHLARAAAGECGARMIVVEIQQVLEMWLGESEKRLHQLFERARAEAPTILFFDEVEAIGAARHQLRHGPGRRLVNQLLAEMDGIGSDNARVLIIGATNAPWDVDPALRRPGRFDRVVFVPPPDLPAREAILHLAFRERPTQALDCAAVARRTARWSGADLVHLAEVASERALQQALRSGSVTPITQSDLVASLDRVKPTTSEWLEAARRYVTYANQAGQYDEVAAYLRGEG